MKTLSFIKKSIYAWVVFFGTLLVLSVGYTAWNSAMMTASSGSTLSSGNWNTLVDNITDLNSRWARNGAALVFTGGNVGIGTESPQENLHISGKLRVDTVSTQESIGVGNINQVGAGSSNIIFNVAGAPILTLGAGTWLIFGSCFLTTTDVPDAVNLALYNTTDATIFGRSGAGTTGYGAQIIGTNMSTTGYLTIPSGTKTIYLYGIRNGSSTLRMGTPNLGISSSALRAIRLF